MSHAEIDIAFATRPFYNVQSLVTFEPLAYLLSNVMQAILTVEDATAVKFELK